MTNGQVILALEKKGYVWKYHSEEFGFDTLTKSKGSGVRIHHTVEVDANGLCNGMQYEEFLRH